LEQSQDLKPVPTEMRGSSSNPELDKLSNIIQSFNDRFGTQFEDIDSVRKVAETIVEGAVKNQEMITTFNHSDDQNARITSDKIVEEEFLKHITSNFDLYKQFSDNKEFREGFSTMVFEMMKVALGKV
jgi:type I restriction enzyme R subunit